MIQMECKRFADLPGYDRRLIEPPGQPPAPVQWNWRHDGVWIRNGGQCSALAADQKRRENNAIRQVPGRLEPLNHEVDGVLVPEGAECSAVERRLREALQAEFSVRLHGQPAVAAGPVIPGQIRLTAPAEVESSVRPGHAEHATSWQQCISEGAHSCMMACVSVSGCRQSVGIRVSMGAHGCNAWHGIRLSGKNSHSQQKESKT